MRGKKEFAILIVTPFESQKTHLQSENPPTPPNIGNVPATSKSKICVPILHNKACTKTPNQSSKELEKKENSASLLGSQH